LADGVGFVFDLADHLLQDVLEVTMPAVSPYSPMTTAMCARACWKSRSSSPINIVLGTKIGLEATASTRVSPPPRRSFS